MSTFMIECLDCGTQAPYRPLSPACPKCGSLWREAKCILSMPRFPFSFSHPQIHTHSTNASPPAGALGTCPNGGAMAEPV